MDSADDFSAQIRTILSFLVLIWRNAIACRFLPLIFDDRSFTRIVARRLHKRYSQTYVQFSVQANEEEVLTLVPSWQDHPLHSNPIYRKSPAQRPTSEP